MIFFVQDGHGNSIQEWKNVPTRTGESKLHLLQ